MMMIDDGSGDGCGGGDNDNDDDDDGNVESSHHLFLNKN